MTERKDENVNSLSLCKLFLASKYVTPTWSQFLFIFPFTWLARRICWHCEWEQASLSISVCLSSGMSQSDKATSNVHYESVLIELHENHFRYEEIFLSTAIMKASRKLLLSASLAPTQRVVHRSTFRWKRERKSHVTSMCKRASRDVFKARWFVSLDGERVQLYRSAMWRLVYSHTLTFIDFSGVSSRGYDNIMRSSLRVES